MTTNPNTLLINLNDHEKIALLQQLRSQFPIHPLEEKWNISAEFVLEAISRSQDITKRGVRGIIAELAFSTHILEPIRDLWKEETITGDQPYDAKLSRTIDGKQVEILIQTKNQRALKGSPLRPTKTAITQNPELKDWFVAETQKTRTGKKKKSKTNEAGKIEVEEIDTRPYRYGEFHILSVCMQPSTNEWSDFMFTPAETLIPSSKSKDLIATLQPVPPANSKHYNWTPDIVECIDWILNPQNMPAPFKPNSKPASKKKDPKNKVSESAPDLLSAL